MGQLLFFQHWEYLAEPLCGEFPGNNNLAQVTNSAITTGNLIKYQLVSNDSLVIKIAKNFTSSMENSINDLVFSILDNNPYIQISVEIDSHMNKEHLHNVNCFFRRSVYHYEMIQIK